MMVYCSLNKIDAIVYYLIMRSDGNFLFWVKYQVCIVSFPLFKQKLVHCIIQFCFEILKINLTIKYKTKWKIC